MLRAMSNEQTEIAFGNFLYRHNSATDVTGPSGSLAPPVPVLTSDPPKILVPNHIGFYRAT